MLRSTLLSDHMPFLAKSDQMNLFSWNILCKMRFNHQWKYFNNGFACYAETDEEYINRLGHIASRLACTAEKDDLAVICLQECPDTDRFHANFEAEIKQKDNLKHYAIQSYHDAKEQYYLMTLYDTKRYVIEPVLTEKMAALALNEGLHKRIFPLVLLHQASHEPILIVNVHADFNKTVKDDVQTVYEAAKKLHIHHAAFLGDFNRDLAVASDDVSKHDISEALDDHRQLDGLYVNAVPVSSFIAKYNLDNNAARTVVETRDGIISTFPVEVVCKVDVNVSDDVLAFNKPISPRLKELPDEILNQVALSAEKLSSQSVVSNYSRCSK